MSPLGSLPPPRMSEHETHGQVPRFPPLGEVMTWGFLPIMWEVPEKGLWSLGATSFSTDFKTAGFMLAQGTGVSQLDSGILKRNSSMHSC